MEFYSFAHRRRVDIPDDCLRRRQVQANGNTRYAVYGSAMVDGKEAKVSKFVSKATYDALDFAET